MPSLERKAIRCTLRRKQNQKGSKGANTKNTFVLTACHLIQHQRRNVCLQQRRARNAPLGNTDWLWNGRLTSTTTITGHPPLATRAEQAVLESLVRESGEDSREETPPAAAESVSVLSKGPSIPQRILFVISSLNRTQPLNPGGHKQQQVTLDSSSNR